MQNIQTLTDAISKRRSFLNNEYIKEAYAVMLRADYFKQDQEFQALNKELEMIQTNQEGES